MRWAFHTMAAPMQKVKDQLERWFQGHLLYSEIQYLVKIGFWLNLQYYVVD